MRMQPHTAPRVVPPQSDRVSDFPPLLAAQFDAERRDLDAMRAAIRRQIESDLDRVDRCLVVLDGLDGDPDITADYTTVEQRADGTLYTLGRSSDDERDAGDEPEGVGMGDATEDDEPDTDSEYSLGWAENVRQVLLDGGHDDADKTAPERHGGGFVRCAADDHECGSDQEDDRHEDEDENQPVLMRGGGYSAASFA